jgi:hypothetical protein
MMTGENKESSDKILVDKSLLEDIARQLSKKQVKKSGKKKSIIVVTITLILIGLISFYVFKYITSSSTLPYPISKQTAGLLGYDIYYPDQKLLPSGYKLDKNSFYDSDQAIIYKVTYGNNQTIVFSDQTKPTESQIQYFYSQKIPLHTSFTTPVGTAVLGAINGKAVVSLPTNSNSWLLINAPSDINQNDLKKVILSIKLAK